MNDRQINKLLATILVILGVCLFYLTSTLPSNSTAAATPTAKAKDERRPRFPRKVQQADEKTEEASNNYTGLFFFAVAVAVIILFWIYKESRVDPSPQNPPLERGANGKEGNNNTHENQHSAQGASGQPKNHEDNQQEENKNAEHNPGQWLNLSHRPLQTNPRPTTPQGKNGGNKDKELLKKSQTNLRGHPPHKHDQALEKAKGQLTRLTTYITDELYKSTLDRSWTLDGNTKGEYDAAAKTYKYTGDKNMAKNLIRTLYDLERPRKKPLTGEFRGVYNATSDAMPGHFDWWIFLNPRRSDRVAKKVYAVHEAQIKALKTYKIIIKDIFSEREQQKYQAYNGEKYQDLLQRAQRTIADVFIKEHWDTTNGGRLKKSFPYWNLDRILKMVHGLLIWDKAYYKMINHIVQLMVLSAKANHNDYLIYNPDV